MSVDLDLLADYLDGDNNEFGLDFAGTHGFLVATVVGPELKDWLNHLFDGNLDSIPSNVVSAVQAWRNDIIQTLLNEEEIGFPVDIEDISLDSSVSDWALGFVDAIFLNEEYDWFEIDEEAVGDLTLPMIVLSGIDFDEEDADLADMREDEDLLEELVEAIPENLTQLYLLFHGSEK